MIVAHRGRRRRRLVLDRLEARALLANAGALDPAFGGGRGFEILPLGEASGPGVLRTAEVGGVAVQADGKAVVGGAVNRDGLISFALERLNPDGTLDPGFGRGGLVLAPLPGDGSGRVAAVLIQPDGKIIEAGAGNLPASGPDPTYIAARLNADGTPDPTFGAGGLASDPAGSAGNRITDVAAAALQPDGKIVLAGSGRGFAAVRLEPDGSLDRSFGAGGTAVVPVTIGGFDTGRASAVALQPDGRIVLAGTTPNGIPVATAPGVVSPFQEAARVRLGPDGTVDASFGGPSARGTVLIPPGTTDPSMLGADRVTGVALQGDGKILLGRTDRVEVSSTDPAVRVREVDRNTLDRLDADGTPDASFGPGGRVSTPVAGPFAILPDGRVFQAGSVPLAPTTGGPAPTQFATARLGPDGRPDPSFGDAATPGLARYDFGPTILDAAATALAIQPDGNVLLVGRAAIPAADAPEGRSVAARVLSRPVPTPIPPPPRPTPPASFDGSGRTDPAVYLPAFGAFAYRPAAAGPSGPDAIVPFGIAGPGQTIPAAADYAGVGRVQVAAYLPAFGTFGIRPPTGGPDLIIPFGIAGPGESIPVPADYEGIGRADLAVYMPAFGTFGIRPSTGGPDRIIPFGIAGFGQSIPAVADYDGDGKADLAVYMPAFGTLGIRPSTGGPDLIIPFGIAGPGESIPVPADYDGDGRADPAVYLPAFGTFGIRPSTGGPDQIIPFGIAGSGVTVPAPGDYSGSGHAELGVYVPAFGSFAYRPGGGGPDVVVPFGSAGPGQSVPVAAPPAMLPPPPPPVFGPAVGVAPAPTAASVFPATRSAAVPAGPMATASPRRSARPSVLQAKADPPRI